MSESLDFDLSELGLSEAELPTSDEKPVEQIEQWAEQQLTPRGGPGYYDIETGPLSEEHLRSTFHEKTLDEFSATCDKRWKSDTVAAKYKEYKVKAWDEYVEKATLSAVTGTALLIGTMEGDEFFPLLHETEAENLANFWTRVECWLSDKCPIIGHNSNGFDLPFLIHRSWILGVPVPREIHRGKNFHPLFQCTQERWFGNSAQKIKLNDLAAAFGVGQKTEGVQGKDFHRLWAGTMPAEEWGNPAEQRQKALDYNEQDLRLTAAVAVKMGMV